MDVAAAPPTNWIRPDAPESHRCDVPPVFVPAGKPGQTTAWSALAKALFVALPPDWWQLMHRFAFPATVPNAAPGALCVMWHASQLLVKTCGGSTASVRFARPRHSIPPTAAPINRRPPGLNRPGSARRIHDGLASVTLLQMYNSKL